MNKQYNGFLRALSAILSLVMMLQLLPVQVLGATEEATAAADSTAAQVQEESRIVTVLGEDESLRGATVKHFRLSDGSSVAVNYGVAVHYRDEDNAWQEIDNRPILSAAQNAYIARNGDAATVYSADLSAGRVLTAAYGDVSVTMGLLDTAQALAMTGAPISANDQAQLVTGGLTFDRTAAATLQTDAQTYAQPTREEQGWTVEELMPAGLSTTVVYEDVFPGVDLEYTAYSQHIKEQIVVYAPQQSYRYDFSLALDGLTAQLNEDGSVALTDASGKTVYTIPAPYMEDSAGAFSTDVSYSLHTVSGGAVLTVTADAGWINDESRVFPVRIDPTLELAVGEANADIYAAYAMKAAPNTPTTDWQPLYIGNMPYPANDELGLYRLFLHFNNLPAIPTGSIITQAELYMYQFDFPAVGLSEIPLAAYDVTTEKPSGYADYNAWFDAITWNNQPQYDASKAYDYAVANATLGYRFWDLTDAAKGWYFEGSDPTIAIVTEDESMLTLEKYGCGGFRAYGQTNPPVFMVTYRSDLGLESCYSYSSASAGRAGTGYVNNYTGNLVWVRGAMGFGGNRMPVSISLAYNANDAQTNRFGLGYGWRTNYHQRIDPVSLNGIAWYIWEDADGTRHYFENKDGVWMDEFNPELTLTVTASGYTISDKYGNKSIFDAKGRLIQKINNQEIASSIQISYNGDTNKITQILDGVGRKYVFNYENSSAVTSIDYTGTGQAPLSQVRLTYNGTVDLIRVTDPDNKATNYAYDAHHLLTSATDIDGYKLSYTYNSDSSYNSRVVTVTESDGNAQGGTLTFAYAHNQTTLTDHNGISQILQFNHWGNLISVQDDQGRGQFAQYARMDENDGGKANQLNLSSKLQNTVGSLLPAGSFESGTAGWGNISSSHATCAVSTEAAYHGSQSLKISRATAGTQVAGAFTRVYLEPNETYTWSAYIKTGSCAVSMVLGKSGQYLIRATVPADSDWTRVEIPLENTTDEELRVTLYAWTSDAGVYYMDCVQVEKAPTASRYNLIENGDFRTTGYWSSDAGRTTVSSAAAPQLETTAYQLTGNPLAQKRVSQTVKVSGTQGDTFVVAGWARGDAAPFRDEHGENRQFGIIATFLDASGNPVGDPATARFNPDVNMEDAWQYAATALVATGDYASVKVELAYDHNINTVCFDGIQLYKEQFGQSYTYDENGNITAVVDIQGQQTKYDYTADGTDLIRQTLPNGAVLEYTYDGRHNPITATSGTGVAYFFTYDKYGNNTEVTVDYDTTFDPDEEIPQGEENQEPAPPVPSGNGMTASAEYTDDGNRLLRTIDALGNVTQYSYNANTNVLEWVQYPNDTDATRTEYTYDSLYRQASATATTSSGSALSAQYSYTDDLLTAIETASTTYSFGYGDFALRSNIKIGSRTLISDSYTNDANRYLQQQTYGNGDHVSFSYDDHGRLLAQTWEDGDTVSYTYDNSGALATVYDSATGRTTTYYYDFTDRLMKYAVTGSNYSHSVEYRYDDTNNLLRLVESINGTKKATSYTYDKDNRVTSAENVINKDEEDELKVKETYTYDSYGRVTQKVTEKDGTVILTEVYTYKTYNGQPTTQVASHTTQNAAGTVVSSYTYSYDANGNITEICDVTTATHYSTTYQYDSANQLIRENNQRRGTTWTWEYDNAGNILSRTEYAYTTGNLGTPTDTINYDYDDSAWGDLLTTYDGSAITYDEGGNPLDDGTWEYTWEHGRQLASMTDGTTTWSYTYDADGLRTGKTDGTTSYSYVYNGGQLSRMTVTTVTETADGQTSTQTHTVDLTYDASGNPQTMTYDGTTYYYTVNIQGDVTGIVDENGNVLVRYTYQAYGTTTFYGVPTDSDGSTLRQINPLTYRGYVYDKETKLYYLQSRYYNRTSGRFINADAFTSTGQGLLGNNMFAYCLNNPVMFSDVLGTFAMSLTAETNADRIPAKGYSAAAGQLLGYVLVTAIACAAAEKTVDAEARVAAKAAILASRDDNDKIYTVYFLRDAKNPSGGIVYVGRVKTANFGARMRYHEARGRALEWHIDGLTYYQCRGLEQVGMAYFHTINRNKKINNQIRGVSPLNGNRIDYFTAAKVFWSESGSEFTEFLPDSYWLNWTENEFLNGGM